MLTIIKLLTWNISYQAMYGIHSKSIDATICMKDGINECKNNILDKILNIPNLDFILLQEPVLNEFQNTLLWNNLLDTYDYVYHKSGKEDMITLYNKYKYTISSSKLGQFEYGRPFQIITFDSVIKGNSKIIVVNLHAPHQELWYLKKLHLSNLDYPIIIAGDFNNSITKDLEINGINFQNESTIIKQMNTCCDHTLNGVNVDKCFDHILINNKVKYNKIQYPLMSGENIKHSDHLPVCAELIIEDNMLGGHKRRIGFDFDGVIHKLIISTEENGQRHSNYSIDTDTLVQSRSKKIIKHIQELQKTSDIKIISSRQNQEQVDHFLKHEKIGNVNAQVIKKARSARKTDIVIDEVDEFYDDSANVLKEIMLKAKEIGKDIKLYFVIPELDKWYEVKTEKDIDKKLLLVELIILKDKLQKILI